jgi:hypothetical protein
MPATHCIDHVIRSGRDVPSHGPPVSPTAPFPEIVSAYRKKHEKAPEILSFAVLSPGSFDKGLELLQEDVTA